MDGGFTLTARSPREPYATANGGVQFRLQGEPAADFLGVSERLPHDLGHCVDFVLDDDGTGIAIGSRLSHLLSRFGRRGAGNDDVHCCNAEAVGPTAAQDAAEAGLLDDGG